MIARARREVWGEAVRAHPFLFGAVVTALWWLVTLLLARGLPPLRPAAFPDLGAALVNLGALAVPLAIIAALGWWHRSGLAAIGPDCRWWTLLPLLLLALSFAWNGLAGSPAQFASTAVLMAILGLNEEILNRGLIQAAAERLRLVPRVIWVGLLFGFAHLGTALFFGQSAYETGAQIISASAFGLAYAAVREAIGTVWPLAALHALSNFCNTRNAVTVPWWWFLTVAILHLAYALALVWWLRRERDGERCESPGSEHHLGH